MWNFRNKIHKSVAEACHVEVTECEGVRNLHLGSTTVQSSMLVEFPNVLTLNYSRGMMCFLLFSSSINDVLIIGLGGGSVTKFMHANCQQIKQTVLEINAQVIQVARNLFCVPENDERLNIIQGDGVQHLLDNPASADCVIIDAFDADGIPPNCSTQDFFDSCFEVLQKDGIFVVNLWGSDKNFDVYLQRIEQSFGRRVLMMPTGKPGNIIVFGFKTPIKLNEKKLRVRAKALEKMIGIEFSDFLDKLHAHNGYAALYNLLESQ